MIRLSDVKVRLQYRWRVRQRLMVLHFARLRGPTAAARRCGVSARTTMTTSTVTVQRTGETGHRDLIASI
jgi:hypothetical protein